MLVLCTCATRPPPDESAWGNPRPDPIANGVAIVERGDDLQVRPQQVMLRERQVDPNDFAMAGNGPADDLPQYAGDLYEAAVRHQPKYPEEAKRLLELAAHAAPHDAALMQKVDARLAELGTVRVPDPDPIPPEVRAAGDEAIDAWVDLITEASYERAIEALDTNRAVAIAHFRRVVAVAPVNDPLRLKAIAELKKLGLRP